MSKTTKLTTISLACALASCASQPTTTPPLTVKPVNEIRHSAGAKPAAAVVATADPYQRGALHQANGDLDSALLAYKSAITSDYRHAEARNAMATIYMRRGEPTEAQAILREAIDQRPNAAYLRNNLGYIEYLQGNHKAAITEFNAALALEPNNEWARNNLKMARAALFPAQPAALANAKATVPAVAAASPFEVWGEAAQADSMDGPPVATVTALGAEPEIAISTAAAQLLVAAKEYRVDVVNSSGVAGLAKRVSESLTRLGIAVGGVTSERPFNRAVTEIQYQDGFESEAKQLAEKLDTTTALKRIPAIGNPEVRVVLGKDLSTRIAGIEAKIIVANAISVTSPAEQIAGPQPTQVSAEVPGKSVEPMKLDEMFSFNVKPYELHVVNANGQRGIARKASDFLRDKGVVAKWVGDERPYRPVTQIVYRDGYLLEAARLRATLPNQPVIVKSESVVGTPDIKLVLGRDLTYKTNIFAQQPLDIVLSAVKTEESI